MPPLPIVEELEVLEELGARRRPSGSGRVMDRLDLQRREEALGKLVVAAGVLTAAIRMMQQTLRRGPARPRPGRGGGGGGPPGGPAPPPPRPATRGKNGGAPPGEPAPPP